jgi:endonuclease/exonuclease/phosphatase family metal-dependent hydrolase
MGSCRYATGRRSVRFGFAPTLAEPMSRTLLSRSAWVSLASSIATLSLACAEPSSGDSSSGTTDTSGESDSGETDSSETDSSETDTGETGSPPDLPEPIIAPEPMVVMTFNILCSFCDDTYDPWEDRIGYISDTIARHDPDLVGLQELFTGEEVQQLLDLNPEYDALFYSDENIDYADATIWWRADRYELLESGFYWLSPTPDVALSVGFSPPQLARMVTWAHLRELSNGAELLFVDTHFDNNTPSQELSAPLLLERTEDQAGALPIIVVGDFNSRPDSPAYAILVGGVVPGEFALTNSFDLAAMWSVDSNQDPVPPYDPDIRIDHMFVAGGQWSVPWWVVDTWVYGASDLHTSDHFAMATELHFEG